MNLPVRDFADVLEALRGPANSSKGKEHRATTRMQVSARVQAHQLADGVVKRSYTFLTRDISLSGVGALQAIPLPKGSEIILELPRQTTPLLVRARVMHCTTLADGLLGLGLEFVSIVPPEELTKASSVQADEVSRVQRAIMG
jgi:hypothetical protein